MKTTTTSHVYASTSLKSPRKLNADFRAVKIKPNHLFNKINDYSLYQTTSVAFLLLVKRLVDKISIAIDPLTHTALHLLATTRYDTNLKL